jgi:hypothetical protein
VTIGYSGTPLPQKLGIKAESRVLTLGAPPGFALAGVTPHVRAGKGPYDVVLAFVTRRRVVEEGIERLGRLVFPAGGLWYAWPKNASKVPTDITEDTLREVALPLGLVDNKVCAVTEVWSGLRFVWRKERRG